MSWRGIGGCFVVADVLAAGRFAFDENERVLCMKCVTLATSQTASGRGQFIVVGTGYIWGEDVATKGRVGRAGSGSCCVRCLRVRS